MEKYMKSLRMRVQSEMRRRGTPVYYVTRELECNVLYMSFTFDIKKSISAHREGMVHKGIHRIPVPSLPNSSEVVKLMCDTLTVIYKKENTQK